MTRDRANDGRRGELRDRLPRIEPPADLETRVGATLAARGLVTPRSTRRAMWVARASLVAAGILIGILVRGKQPTRPTEADGKAGQYALLLYGVPPEDTGAIHAARAKEYGQWASSLRGDARWVGGHEFAGVVETLGPATQADAEPGNRVAGFFIIEASSPERAAEVARSCPHLKYGGRVVVMAIAT